MKNLFFILIIGLTNQYVLAFFCSLKLPLTTWLILFQTQNDLEKKLVNSSPLSEEISIPHSHSGL